MRRLCIACIAAVLTIGLVHAALAADMPTKAPVAKTGAPYNWGGFYVGAHAGYLWSSTQVTDTGVVVESNARTNGFIGGALAGYNYQMGEIVLGLEGDFGWSNAHGTGFAVVFAPNQYDLDWTGHLRGRLGYAPGQGPWLFYVAGGLAVTRFVFTDGETGERTSSIYTGGSIGGGIEYGFTSMIIGRAEFLYDIYSGNGAVLHDYSAMLQNASTARGAIVFKF